MDKDQMAAGEEAMERLCCSLGREVAAAEWLDIDEHVTALNRAMTMLTRIGFKPEAIVAFVTAWGKAHGAQPPPAVLTADDVAAWLAWSAGDGTGDTPEERHARAVIRSLSESAKSGALEAFVAARRERDRG